MDKGIPNINSDPPYKTTLLGALIAATAFVLVLCILPGSQWETNDDVGMSMVAHGFGMAAYGSPNLIFSNVLWGYLVRLIPEFNGILGYSIATFVTLIATGTVLIFGLFKSRLGLVGAASVLVLLLMRPVLFPQFTINAGLAMIGAIICVHLFAETRDRTFLAFGLLLAYCSYLIRSQEFLLVLLVAIPLLPWSALIHDRVLKIGIAILISAIGLSAIINHQAYSTEEWQTFNELNSARAPFTDFGAGGYLKQEPEILKRYGYSSNDIDLISRWFFVDPEIADPEKLNGMLRALGPLPTQSNSLARAQMAIETLFHPNLLPIVVLAAVLAAIRPSRKVLLTWALSIGAIFVIGLMGRPGVLRVYIPLVSLLVIAPLLGQWRGPSWRKRLAIVAILAAAAFNTSMVYSKAKISHANSEKIRQGLRDFPEYPVIAWGEGFPYEAAYRPFETRQPPYHLYALGVFTHAPFSVAFLEQSNGNGLTDQLLQKAGLPIIASEQRLNYLEIYCRERLNGRLRTLSSKNFGSVRVNWQRCEMEQTTSPQTSMDSQRNE